MYDILKLFVLWKIWQRGAPNFTSRGPRMALIRLWTKLNCNKTL